MNHPTSEDLVSYLYLDGEDAASLEAHLEGCPACQDEVRLLRQVLAEVSESDPVPERPDDYPARVWERLEAELPRRESAPRRPLGSRLRFGMLLAAAAVVLVATFLAGRFSGRSTSSPEGQTAHEAREERVRERILLVALSDHIEESQVLLLEVANRDGSDSPSNLDRRRAEELLRASRLYRQTASRLGDVATADVLEELERVLLDVSHAADSRDWQKSIRDRIRDEDVLFKLRVLDKSVKSREHKLAIRKF